MQGFISWTSMHLQVLVCSKQFTVNHFTKLEEMNLKSFALTLGFSTLQPVIVGQVYHHVVDFQ